jgi:hypothetical protein
MRARPTTSVKLAGTLQQLFPTNQERPDKQMIDSADIHREQNEAQVRHILNNFIEFDRCSEILAVVE